MSDPAGNSGSNSAKLNHILAEYIRRRDAGEAVDVESICGAHPDIAEELRSFAAGEGLVEAMIGAGDSAARDPSEVESASMDSSETLRPGAAQGTAFQPNSQFGRYRIIRLLGEGAMGSIYLAQDTNLEREVALKIPKLAGLNKEEFLQRFTREAKAAARLDHPNVCRVYDADEVNDTPYITIEYINGQPLSRFIGTTELKDQRRVAEIIKQIAEGLAHAHAAGILHRDLKPGNVLMRDNKIPCVSDFGLARRVDSGDESQLTHEGTILGTPAYMAPEQIEGKPDKIGPAADIYSLGVMLYYLLTEELPFKGSIMSILGQAMRDQPKAPSKVRGDIDQKLEDLCLSMMEKSPNKRPASMNDVATILADWLETASPQQQEAKQKQQKNREVLAKRKAKIEELIERGQFAAAMADLEKMATVKNQEATAYVKWAREKIPEMKSLPAKMKKNAPLIIATAREFMQKHDYAQAAQLIQNIPRSLRNREAQKLLAQAIEWEDEAELLLDFLKECVETRQFKGIEENLDRFLELKPGSSYGRELKEKLDTYSKLPFEKRKFRFDAAGELQPRTAGSIWDNWLVLGAVCFVLVFGVLTWGITIYLKNDDQTIAVEIDDEWLEAQGGSVSLVVDGDEHTISGAGLEVTVSLGEHGFSVKNGETVVHNPEEFKIEKQGRQVLRIDSRGMTLGKSEKANSQEDRLPSSTSNPQSIVDTDPSESQQWTDLFNGRDFTGWVQAKDGQPIRRAWKIQNGAIHRSSGPLVGDIRTEKKYGNFELEFDWKVGTGGNSGVMYRIPDGTNEPWQGGPEYQLFDKTGFKGTLKPEQETGAIYGLFSPNNVSPNPAGQWNSSRIIADGNRLEHWLNGQKVASAEIGSADWKRAIEAYGRLDDYPNFAKTSAGYIVLQDHKSDIWFRNIRIREINDNAVTQQWNEVLPNLTDPKGISGWNKSNANELIFRGPGGKPLLLPGELPEDYELEVNLETKEPLNQLVFVLPVKERLCAFVLRKQESNWGGLEMIDGRTYIEYPTKISEKLIPKASLRLNIQVQHQGYNSTIVASADGQEVYRWEGATNRLTLTNHWDHGKPNRLAIGGGQSTLEAGKENCVVRSIRWRELSAASANATNSEPKESSSESTSKQDVKPTVPIVARWNRPSTKTDTSFVVEGTNPFIKTDWPAGARWIDKQGIPFRWCPPGEYGAGNPPQKILLTSGYWLSEHEITQIEWKRVTGKSPWEIVKETPRGYDIAASGMTYGEAMEFAQKKNSRAFSSLPSDCAYILPSEALWEYACRAGTTTEFYFGDDASPIKDHAWIGGRTPREVAKKRPNPWGFYDMYGNVGEIVLDTWSDEPLFGTDPLKTGSLGAGRILRGESWWSSKPRTTSRARRNPHRGNGDEGVRLAIAQRKS